MSSKRPRKTVTPSPNPALARLTPSTEPLGVGDQTVRPASSPAVEAKPARRRVPFGTYLPPELQREFKARCVLLGVEMQDGTEQAIRAWLEENPA